MSIIKGKLDPFSETGTEGVIWAVYDDTKKGYDGLHCLEYGDYLTVFDPEDPTKIVWKGTIDYDWERNRRPYPLNPQYGQQEVGGMWVHGLQVDVEPNDWATWFFKTYPAELIKANFGHFTPTKSGTIDAYCYTGRKHYSDSSLDRSGTLTIKFRNGSFYKYKDVEPSVFWEFYSAESKGTFLAKNIKKKYEFEKLETPQPVTETPSTEL